MRYLILQLQLEFTLLIFVLQLKVNFNLNHVRFYKLTEITLLCCIVVSVVSRHDLQVEVACICIERVDFPGPYGFVAHAHFSSLNWTPAVHAVKHHYSIQLCGISVYLSSFCCN